MIPLSTHLFSHWSIPLTIVNELIFTCHTGITFCTTSAGNSVPDSSTVCAVLSVHLLCKFHQYQLIVTWAWTRMKMSTASWYPALTILNQWLSKIQPGHAFIYTRLNRPTCSPSHFWGGLQRISGLVSSMTSVLVRTSCSGRRGVSLKVTFDWTDS